MAQGVIQKREWMIFGQGRQPERQLRQVHGHGILVHAVEAALRDQSAGVQNLILVWRNGRQLLMRVPGHDQHIAKLPTRFHQKRSGAHR